VCLNQKTKNNGSSLLNLCVCIL